MDIPHVFGVVILSLFLWSTFTRGMVPDDNVHMFTSYGGHIGLQKAHRQWKVVAKVLGRTGASVKAWVMVYKEVVQAVLLYGRKIWVVTDTMMTVPEGFNNRIARRIVVMIARKDDGREWEWALVGAVSKVTWIWSIREYARKRKATIMEYVSGIPM